MMNRREFVKLLGAGTLMALLVPSVADAFQAGTLSEDDLFNLLTSEGGQGMIHQEALVLERLPNDAHGRRRFKAAGKVTHHYKVTGDAFGNRPRDTSVVAKQMDKFIPGYRCKEDGTPCEAVHRVVTPQVLPKCWGDYATKGDLPSGLWEG
jgi:hypothetical protein